jgi:hypothetical protein
MDDDRQRSSFSQQQIALILAGIVVFARLVNLIAMPIEGLRGYGDFLNYYLPNQLAGLPFIHYWVEYPPLFPFLTHFLYQLSAGKEHIFTYLLISVLTAADAGSLVLFWMISNRLFSDQQAL